MYLARSGTRSRSEIPSSCLEALQQEEMKQLAAIMFYSGGWRFGRLQ